MDGIDATSAPCWRRLLRIASFTLLVYAALVFVLQVLGHHVKLPDSNNSWGTLGGGMPTAVQQLLGHPDPRDIYVDYASAHALMHGGDAYVNSQLLFKGIGPAWDIENPNPHPPTALSVVIPFAFFSYGTALCAWTLAMVFAYVATLRLVGVRLRYSIAIAVAITITFPGAYGIGNVVPLIGLGIAVAYRYRFTPVVAGLGIALAALPKSSGLIMLVPFIVAARIKTTLWAVFFYAVSAVVPMLWQHNIWRRYLTAGPEAVKDVIHRRPDNASVLQNIHVWLGWDYPLILLVFALMAVMIALIQRDLFWAPVWAMVATLPIAWMYSLLTLVPLIAWSVVRWPRRVGTLSCLVVGLTLGSPPLNDWPRFVYIVVVALTGVICALSRARIPALWFTPSVGRLVDQFSNRSLKEKLT